MVSIEDLLEAISRVPYLGNTTNTGESLMVLREETFMQINGDRNNVPNVAIVFSDGNSNVDPNSTVYQAKLTRLFLSRNFLKRINGGNQKRAIYLDIRTLKNASFSFFFLTLVKRIRNFFEVFCVVDGSVWW